MKLWEKLKCNMNRNPDQIVGEGEVMMTYKEIIEFSELGEFIDRPVKTYSSGMYSKLAFSITAILETEIMLIDEVLSVGDAKFKKKSHEKMKSLIDDKDRTVIIVSHSMEEIAGMAAVAMCQGIGETGSKSVLRGPSGRHTIFFAGKRL